MLQAEHSATPLRRLCRCVLRPSVTQHALECTAEGKVLLRLRRPWRDGTREICFEPNELLEKLAAMIPRPRANLLLYHGAFAPRGCWREHAAVRLRGEATAPIQALGVFVTVHPGAWARRLRQGSGI